jgi:hypothetical protein
LLSLLLSSEKTPTICTSSNNSPLAVVRSSKKSSSNSHFSPQNSPQPLLGNSPTFVESNEPKISSPALKSPKRFDSHVDDIDEIFSNHSSPINKKQLSPFPSSGSMDSPGSSYSGSNSPNEISNSSISATKSLSPLLAISKSSPQKTIPSLSNNSPKNFPTANLESKSFVDMPYGETGDNYSDGDDNNDENSVSYLSEEFNQTLTSNQVDKSKDELEEDLGVSDSFVETSIEEVPEDLSNSEQSFVSKSFEEKKNSLLKTITPSSTRQIQIEGRQEDSVNSPNNNRTANIKRLGNGGVTRSKAGWGNDIRDEDNDDFMFGEEEKVLDSTSPGRLSRNNINVNQSHSFSDGDDIDVLENLDEAENAETDELLISHRSNQDEEDVEEDVISEKSNESNNSYSDDNNSDDNSDNKIKKLFSRSERTGISSGEGKSGTFLSSPDHNKESEKSKFDEDGDDYGDDFEEELEESIADEIDSVIYSEDDNSDAISDKVRSLFYFYFIINIYYLLNILFLV